MQNASPKPTAKLDRPLILAVDDDEDILALYGAMLQPRYALRLAGDGEKGLDAAIMAPQPDLILLDVEMPGFNGYQVCAKLKANPATQRIPVIFVTARSSPKDEAHGLSLGAVDYIPKPLNNPIVLQRVATHLALSSQTRQLEHLVAERTRELSTGRLQILQRIARALEYRKGTPTDRVMRIGEYVRALALAGGARNEVCDVYAQASTLYDIGMLAVSESVLRATEKLSEAQWAEMRRHPDIGAAIIGEQADPLLATARSMAHTHHERWDGSGYPKGLAGEAIPVPGRIMAVVDAFEAMTSSQPHRVARLPEEAAREIRTEAGKQFDPAVVAAFDKALPSFLQVRQMLND
jgi:putative two-component system response regulator